MAVYDEILSLKEAIESGVLEIDTHSPELARLLRAVAPDDKFEHFEEDIQTVSSIRVNKETKLAINRIRDTYIQLNREISKSFPGKLGTDAIGMFSPIYNIIDLLLDEEGEWK